MSCRTDLLQGLRLAHAANECCVKCCTHSHPHWHPDPTRLGQQAWVRGQALARLPSHRSSLTPPPPARVETQR